MVGLIDPNPPKLPDKPNPPNDWWKSAVANPIQIKRPAEGRFSPKTDERCFTWCSQSVRGRFEGQDPWCRSICIRRVFAHEVKQLTSHFSQDSASHSRTLAGSEHTLKYPLPPEGQPSSAIVDGIVGGPNLDGRPSAQDVRYWEEGWYIWMTKNRWSAQEKMDLMMLDLDRQTNWMRVKEHEERVWFDAEMERVRDNVRAANSAGGDEGHIPPAVVPEDLDQQIPEGPVRHPYPNAVEESFLFRIPSKFPPLSLYAQQTLEPTWKVLGIVQESVRSGEQKELALRLWETARSGAPFTLVGNVFKACADALKRGPKDGDS